MDRREKRDQDLYTEAKNQWKKYPRALTQSYSFGNKDGFVTVGENQHIIMERISNKLVSVYDAYQKWLGSDAKNLLEQVGCDDAAYLLADGRYMDRINAVYIYDGKDTWTDESGTEWNKAVK